MSIARWAGIGWWLIPVAYVLLLAAPSATLPSDDLGVRRFHTPALAPYMRLGQTFTMTADGFYAIEVFPVATSGVSTDVHFELYERHDDDSVTLVRSTARPADARVDSSPYRFEFQPIPDSKDQTFRFDLFTASGEGAALWATKGVGYSGGAMHANGKDRWADLEFRTYAPTPSVWARLMRLRDTNPLRAYVVIAAFIGIWLLIGLVVRTLPAIPT